MHGTVAFEDMTAAESGHEPESFPWLLIKPQYLDIKKPAESYKNCSVERFRNGKTHVVRSATFKEYANLVSQYSRRRLEFHSDVLNAFAGLSHVMELCFKSPVKQGLPENLLDMALMWRPAERLERRPTEGLPSWSWAGWKGPVKYEDAFRIDLNDWTPKRIASDNGTEPLRPLLRFFAFKHEKVEPINCNGLGIPLQLKSEELPEEWDKYPH